MQNPDAEPQTIEVSVRYYSIIVDQVGAREDRWIAPATAKLADLVAWIAGRHPAFAEYAQAADSHSGNPLRVFLNKKVIMNMEHPLADGDQVRLFPVISGG